jgi:lipoprotein-releasing system permease protein
MIRPLEVFIGWRYARSREAGFFVSFITWASLAGVALGVAALITILSVMNGFEGELRDRLVSLSAHATVESTEGPLGDWRKMRLAALSIAGVSGAAPYLERQALLTHGAQMSGALLRGVEPELEPGVSTISASMVEGELKELVPGASNIVLGRGLAYQLGVSVGEPVTVMIPDSVVQSGEIVPRIRSFTVSGIFEVGLQDHDGVLALISLADAEAMADSPGPNGLRLKFNDLYSAPRLSRVVAEALGANLKARDWTEENATYFRAIRLEKTMMTLMLLLVVGVAAFNIVASLVMVVRAKRTDIAILRTLGMRQGAVVGVFLAQGLVIGWAGTLLGVGLGLTLASHAEQIMAFLQRLLHFQLFSSDVYYVTRIPSVIEPRDVVLIALTAFVLTLSATIYPALRAARTEPAEALRYE